MKSIKLKDNKKLDDIKIYLTDNASVEPKWYAVLSVGKMYSKKYNGVWDSNPELYFNEEGEGAIEIRENFLQSLVDNFKNNALETIPYIDINHEENVSGGPIIDVKLENGTLYIKPEWNDLGKKAIEQKQYMYLSATIKPHKNSKTGEWTFPVLYTTSLTNIPVQKNQSVLELSEAKASSGIKLSIGGNRMTLDELIGSITEMTNNIKQMIDADETGVIKAAIGKAIDHMEITCGLATEEGEEEEMEVEEKPEGEEMKDIPEMKTGVLPGQENKPAPSDTQMSEENKQLKDRLRKLEIQLTENAFEKAFVGKKITPAQKDRYFKLYLSDQETTKQILAEMPDLNLTVELGSDNDIQLSEMKGLDAKKQFEKLAIELAEKDKISSDKAADIIRQKNPELYKKAYNK